MPFSFLVACFVNDDTLAVNRELCLYGVPFLLARIVHLPSSFAFRPWYLLLCAVCEGHKAWKAPFNLFWCAQPFGCFVHLLRDWHALSDQRLNLLHVPADAALVQVKQKAGQRVGNVKAVICKKHQKPVLDIQLEMPACAYGSFSSVFSFGQPLDFMPAVSFCHFLVINVIKLPYRQAGE